MGRLILTRNISQKVLIGKNLEIDVEILGVQGNQVRLAIKANDDIRIVRSELINKEEGKNG